MEKLTYLCVTAKTTWILQESFQLSQSQIDAEYRLLYNTYASLMLRADSPKRIIIIAGAGWYGSHIAIQLSKAGHSVLVEKEDRIVSQCSGKFGIRVHRGPHYPRSPGTRLACQSVFHRFCDTYPELVHEHEESIYAYENLDEQVLPSKISLEDFENVSYETKDAQRLDDEEIFRFGDIAAAFELREPSIAIGAELRRSLEKRLCETSVERMFETEVQNFELRSNKIAVFYCKTSCPRDNDVEEADFLINATGYQWVRFPSGESLETHPPPIDIVYQLCIGFHYEDMFPGARPVSFIVMDGWYPCMMPLIDKNVSGYNQQMFKDYVVTHRSLTILGSFKNVHEASKLLQDLDSPSILGRIRESVENEMSRFLPSFRSRFVYEGWTGSVLAKPRSKSEFRSSLVFAHDRAI